MREAGTRRRGVKEVMEGTLGETVKVQDLLRNSKGTIQQKHPKIH